MRLWEYFQAGQQQYNSLAPDPILTPPNYRFRQREAEKKSKFRKAVTSLLLAALHRCADI